MGKKNSGASWQQIAGILSMVGGILLTAPPAWSIDSDTLLKLLIRKGLITEEDIAQVETELAPKQTEGVQPPAALEERLTKLEQTAGDKSTIHVGHGTLKLGGLLQGWSVWDENDNDRFRVRRTEVKFSGDILGDQMFKYTVMIDPVQVQEDNTRRSILQDALFTIDHMSFLPHHKLDLGQYKLPLTEEGLRSSAKLDTAERSYIARTFGDQRDIGAMLTGDWPGVTYQAGVFNGSGQNQADANDQKDVAGRIVVRPLKALKLEEEYPDIGQIELGLSGYYRPDHGSTRDKKRLGYEARYEYKNLFLKWEYMFGQGTASANATSENSTKATGWYVEAGYTLSPWIPKLEAVAKFESWDPNELVSLDKERDLTLGLNYFINKENAKVQLNYIHKDEQATEIDNDQLIGALQYAY